MPSEGLAMPATAILSPDFLGDVPTADRLLAALYYATRTPFRWPDDWDADLVYYVVQYHLLDLRHRDPQGYRSWWASWIREWICFHDGWAGAAERMADFLIWYESQTRVHWL